MDLNVWHVATFAATKENSFLSGKKDSKLLSNFEYG